MAESIVPAVSAAPYPLATRHKTVAHRVNRGNTHHALTSQGHWVQLGWSNSVIPKNGFIDVFDLYADSKGTVKALVQGVTFPNKMNASAEIEYRKGKWSTVASLDLIPSDPSVTTSLFTPDGNPSRITDSDSFSVYRNGAWSTLAQAPQVPSHGAWGPHGTYDLVVGDLPNLLPSVWQYANVNNTWQFTKLPNADENTAFKNTQRVNKIAVSPTGNIVIEEDPFDPLGTKSSQIWQYKNGSWSILHEWDAALRGIPTTKGGPIGAVGLTDDLTYDHSGNLTAVVTTASGNGQYQIWVDHDGKITKKINIPKSITSVKDGKSSIPAMITALSWSPQGNPLIGGYVIVPGGWEAANPNLREAFVYEYVGGK